MYKTPQINEKMMSFQDIKLNVSSFMMGRQRHPNFLHFFSSEKVFYAATLKSLAFPKTLILNCSQAGGTTQDIKHIYYGKCETFILPLAKSQFSLLPIKLE